MCHCVKKKLNNRLTSLLARAVLCLGSTLQYVYSAHVCLFVCLFVCMHLVCQQSLEFFPFISLKHA